MNLSGKACSQSLVRTIAEGKQVHGLSEDLFVLNSLISVHSACVACQVFFKID